MLAGTTMGIRQRLLAKSDGSLVHIPSPAEVDEALRPASALPVIGPTCVGEWLMIDVRVARAVPPDTRLYKICQELTTSDGRIGVQDGTLIIDLLEVREDADRWFLLDKSNWPEVTE